MMNVFKQYGIKEVADVVFYSITRVGDEEFYTPVLYFDTLKVSSLDKKVNNVTASGGKGNGKIISWSFDKGVTLKLEDALFSQMSLDAFMNGRVMAKMSDWTSAIAKLNVANKYGQKHYSTKAFPSPALTDAEWEIVYRCAQKAGYDPRYGTTEGAGKKNAGTEEQPNHSTKYVYATKDRNTIEDGVVAENRWLLKDAYYRRTQKTPHSRDLSPFFDFNESKYECLSLLIKDYDYPEHEREEAEEFKNLEIGQRLGGWRDLVLTYRDKTKEAFKTSREESLQTNTASTDMVLQLSYSLEKTPTGCKCNWAYISADNMKDLGCRHHDWHEDYGHDDTTIDIVKDIFTGYDKRPDIPYNPTFHIGNEFFLNHILFYLFPHYLEDALEDLCWCDMHEIIHPAMPQKVIDYITQEIDTFSKAGYFENDLYESTAIDRFEKCIVTDRKGLQIDLIQQMLNVKKMYNNQQETFSVFYDAKTMLPFMQGKVLDEKILAQKCVRVYKNDKQLLPSDYLPAIKSYLENQYDKEWVDSLTEDDYVINRITDHFGRTIVANSRAEIVNPTNPEGFTVLSTVGTRNNKTYAKYTTEDGFFLIYFNIIKRDYINLKFGTTYYKWSRTIDEDVNDITYIGTDISIDADTFSGEYLIVGETLVREQKTGKDQRCQFIVNRAAISASTKIQLQAGGSPSTFSIDIDALVPLNKNKAVLELRQYDVEPDKVQGGYKILPQDKRHAYTPTMQVREEIVINNEEIY